MSFLVSTSPSLKKGLNKSLLRDFGYDQDKDWIRDGFWKRCVKQTNFLIRQREKIRPQLRLIKVLIRVNTKKYSAVYYLRCHFFAKS